MKTVIYLVDFFLSFFKINGSILFIYFSLVTRSIRENIYDNKGNTNYKVILSITVKDNLHCGCRRSGNHCLLSLQRQNAKFVHPEMNSFAVLQQLTTPTGPACPESRRTNCDVATSTNAIVPSSLPMERKFESGVKQKSLTHPWSFLKSVKITFYVM